MEKALVLLRTHPFHLLALLGAGLVTTAFILQHGFGVLPCPMCWWQRYAHISILILALLGLAAPSLRRQLLLAIAATATVGLAIAIWQFAAQQHWLPYPPTCTSAAAQALSGAADLLAALNNQPPVIPCDKETFHLLGLSLAAWNIPTMLATLLFSLWNFKQQSKS